MKITKSQLKRIIKQELEGVLKEAYAEPGSPRAKPGYGAFRPAGSPVDDPDSDEDDAAEIAAGLDLTGFELVKDRGFYFIVDKESGERVLGPFRTEKQAGKRAARSDTRSEFEAAKNVLNRLR